MCAPLIAAAPFIAMGISALAGGAAVANGVAGANAERMTAEQRQAAANKQADFMDRSANDTEQRGSIDASRLRMAGDKTIAAQRVGYAASGVDISSGTPVQAMATTRMLSEYDALTAKNNAAREAWGIHMNADAVRQGATYDAQAANAHATGTLLGGVAGGVGSLGSALGYAKGISGSSSAGSSPPITNKAESFVGRLW